MDRHKAILLIGPTGCGKTPFGNYCEQKGLYGVKCFHFDFGEALRQIDQMDPFPLFLTNRDQKIIRNSLNTGELLEDEYFHIAQSILRAFIERKKHEGPNILILNGLPRHQGQARDIEDIVDIKLVICFECPAATVQYRIALNSGGDRNERIDDSLPEIEKKLLAFEQRTLPLMSYYRSRDIPVETVHIELNTKPEDINQLMENSYHI